MPPRYAYWTILAGGLPTAFRSAERDDLLPTFQRIREKHPDAEMKWFARGKLWASPEEAQQARGQGTGHDRGQRPQRDGRGPRSAEGAAAGSHEPRNRNWRPGGEHRDPRQKYKDAKKEKNLEHRKERFARKHGGEDRPRDASRPREERPQRDFKRPQDRKPFEAPRGDWKSREHKEGWTPREKPHGDKLRPQAFRPREDRGPRDDRRPWENRPPRRDFKRDDQNVRSDRPSTFAKTPVDRSGPPKGDWRDRPPREKPHGDKLRPQSFRPREDRGPRDERRPWENRPPRGDFKRDDDKGRRDRPSTFAKPPVDRSGPQKRDWRDRPPADRKPPQRDWNERPPREKPQSHGGFDASKPRGGGSRPFERKQFDRKGPGGQSRAPGRSTGREGWRDRDDRGRGEPRRDSFRGGGTEEPKAPARSPGPNREPRPGDEPPPQSPPRPNEPGEPPSGPPERGRGNDRGRSAGRGKWSNSRKPPRRRE